MCMVGWQLGRHPSKLRSKAVCRERWGAGPPSRQAAGGGVRGMHRAHRALVLALLVSHPGVELPEAGQREEVLERPAELARRDEQQRKGNRAIRHVYRMVEGAATPVVLLRDVGPYERQLDRGIQVTAEHCVHERRPAALIGGIHIRTSDAQGLRGVGVPVGSGEAERTHAQVVDLRHLRPILEQLRELRDGALGCSCHQRGAPLHSRVDDVWPRGDRHGHGSVSKAGCATFVVLLRSTNCRFIKGRGIR